jgi:hypothetical protein
LEGHGGYAPYIKLNFTASSIGLGGFTRHICEGVLHQGYDPYNAVNTSTMVSGQQQHLIKYHGYNYTYYSHTVNAPDAVWGNRCQIQWGPYEQLRVEQVSPYLFDVTVDAGHHLWEENCPLTPCISIGNNFVAPIHDFPLVVMGLQEDKPDEFSVVTDELCLHLQANDYRWNEIFGWMSPKWEYLRNAKLSWTVDDEPQGDAVISNYDAIMRVERQQHFHYFDYCIMRDWTPGRHSMTLDVLTTSSDQQTYQWDFHAD